MHGNRLEDPCISYLMVIVARGMVRGRLRPTYVRAQHGELVLISSQKLLNGKHLQIKGRFPPGNATNSLPKSLVYI